MSCLRATPPKDGGAEPTGLKRTDRSPGLPGRQHLNVLAAFFLEVTESRLAESASRIGDDPDSDTGAQLFGMQTA